MELERLQSLDNLVVGKKQTKRFILKSMVDKVFVAMDAEREVTDEIIQLCNKEEIEIVYIDKMKELGEICNIDVNAAVVAVLK
ncbi:MAG TPA: 50S ribosomal protein L7ae-like protein [Clostridiales bacterium]|jgi:large subunit ribosomal protein L7A|nr:50S ribosomal protein L7ae-like protein [Clostridiales bacterium]